MEIRLTETERERMRAMVRRPRSRKQGYRAEALIALGEGNPIEEVARRCKVGVERVEGWGRSVFGATAQVPGRTRRGAARQI